MKKKSAVLGKRGVILGLLVVVLGLAVYLNWYVSKEETPSVTDVLTGSALGQAMYVNGDASSVAQTEDYFSLTRTNREEARKQADDKLREIVENVKSDSSAVAEATKERTALAGRIEDESNIEALVKAKGFDDCVVVLSEDSVNVVVKTEGLTGSQTVQIQEIVQGQTKISLENIKIIEAK